MVMMFILRLSRARRDPHDRGDNSNWLVRVLFAQQTTKKQASLSITDSRYGKLTSLLLKESLE